MDEPKEVSEVSPYEAMDTADENQIVQDLEGKLSPLDMEKFVYSFMSGGKEQTGLSFSGVKYAWWYFNKEKTADITITQDIKTETDEDYVHVWCYALDRKRNIGMWGASSQTKMMKSGGMMIRDPFAAAKATSKAQRNAVSNLFPKELVAKLIKIWIKQPQNVQKIVLAPSTPTQGILPMQETEKNALTGWLINIDEATTPEALIKLEADFRSNINLNGRYKWLLGQETAKKRAMMPKVT